MKLQINKIKKKPIIQINNICKLSKILKKLSLLKAGVSTWLLQKKE